MKQSRLLVLACVLLAACGERASDSPVGPPAAQNHNQGGPSTSQSCPSGEAVQPLINAIIPHGERSSVQSRYNRIYKSTNSAAKKTQALQLVDWVLKKYQAGALLGGQSSATRAKTIQLLNAILCVGGLPQTFGPLSLGDNQAAAVIFPNTPDTNIVTGTKFAGVTVPQGSVTEPTLVQITLLPGTGPLDTPFDQYPLFYEFSASPAQTFGQDLTVGVCLAASATPPDVNRLRVAHNVTGGGIEIAPIAPAPFLDCTDADVAAVPSSGLRNLARGGGRMLRDVLAVFAPQPLYAFAGAGVGGTVRTFSPFGLVDTLGILTIVSPVEQEANTYAPPAVTLTTPLGRAMAGVPVNFVIYQGRGLLTGGNAVTDATGRAAATSWIREEADRSFVSGTPVVPARTGIANAPALFVGKPPQP